MSVTNKIWPLVIVGRGSSAAYYVSTVDLNEYRTILAIGEDDAWAGKRGHAGDASDPTLKINHPLHLLAHFRETIPGFSTELVDRLDWARMNEAVLRDCNVQIHQASVKLVSEASFPSTLAMDGDLGPLGFRIDLQGPNGAESVYAYKVVLCAGTGGHRVPAELTDARKAWPKQVLDLDEFAKLGARDLTAQTKVIVIGPNAAIDGVHKALNYQSRIEWLIDLDHPKAPGMLATQPRMLDAWKDPAKHKLNVHRYTRYSFGGRTSTEVYLNVTPRDGGAPRRVYGDYLAYGVGPDGAPNRMIDNTIQAKLKPISDGTRALNNDPSKPATVLGYEAEGTGLKKGFEVFGAMSGSIGRDIANSKDRLKVLKEQIDATRVTYDLFTAITTAHFPVAKPFLAKDPEFLAKQPRAALFKQLHTELEHVVKKNATQTHLRAGLEALANQILAYHTAAAYAALGDRDPNSLKNFRELLNQVATNLPKGAVADHGQLTSINAALGAYATMRGPLPKYMPKQQFTTPGPKTSGTAAPVKVTTTAGNINFNLDNAQNLAIYVCASFPNIPPDRANAFVDKVMRERHASATGFTDQKVAEFKKELATLEAAGLRAVLTSL